MGRLSVKEFSKWLKEQVGMPYLWGGQNESLFDLIRGLAAKKEQSDKNTEKMIAFIEKKFTKDIRFFDCSGLAVAYLLEKKAITSDMTAAMLYQKCTPIKENEVVEGCWCFLKNSNGIYHIGYIVDNDMVVHAYNQEKGVIMEKRTARKWIYARPDFAFAFENPQNAPVSTLKVGDKVTITESINGYNTADNALKGKNPTTTYEPGEYYVYKIYKGSVNISKKKGVPGAWVVL